jgi:hypothetical protein
MQEWEYTIGSWNNMQLAKLDDIAKFLNDSYGKDGWELISAAVFPNVTGSGGAGIVQISVETDFRTIMIFKRLKPSK